MMKWTRLQLNRLPIIAVEADNAVQKLQELIKRVNFNGLNEDIQQLNDLRQSILTRIEALQKFYQQNYLDSTINIFHMIKLKLKKAVFKIQRINNETIQIQLKTPAHMRQRQLTFQQFRIKGNEYLSKNNSDSRNFQVYTRKNSKSRSQSRIKQKKDQILKLLQASNREEDETNLMQQIQPHNLKANFHQHSFDFNEQFEAYEPLFKTSPKKHNPKVQSKKILNKKNGEAHVIQNQKSLSPFKEKQTSNFNNNNYKTSQNNKNNILTKNKVQSIKVQPQKKSNMMVKQKANLSSISSKNINVQYVNKKNTFKHNQKQERFEKDAKKQQSELLRKNQQVKRLKTEGEQIKVLKQQTKQDPGQFRFTIKMTKQQYRNLLKMKQLIKYGKPV